MKYITPTWNFIKGHKWRVLIAALVFLPVAAIAAFALSPVQPEYVTAAVERGDVLQTVEAVGTIISDRDLELQFPISGVIAQVYVKEGDVVQPGQRLAALRAGNLAADISSAAARVQQAQADYRKLEEGNRPEDIAISEAEVASKRASLETARTTLATAEDSLEQSERKLTALKQEALTSLVGSVANAGSTVLKEITSAQTSLSVVRDVFGNNDVIDAIIKESPSEYDSINAALHTAETTLSSLYVSAANPQEYQDALLGFDQAKIAVAGAWSVVSRAFDLISRLQTSAYFSESDRESFKADLNAQKTLIQTSLHALEGGAKTLRDASATYSTRIASEEAAVSSAKGTMDKARSDIATYEAALRISEAQLQLKKAPVRKSDLDSAAASVRQARAALARASADYSNTVITAPIAGRITKVHAKPGEFTPTGASITMLGNSPYRIEMYVSEIDVPKVQLTQTGSIELDAFRGTHFKLRVTEVDSAATDRDGVPKYRVRMDFVYPHDELKIGMTGDARIETGKEENVLSVPLRAVLERDDGANYVRIIKEDGEVEEREVEVGLEGEGGTIAVTNVDEGETVIVLEKK